MPKPIADQAASAPAAAAPAAAAPITFSLTATNGSSLAGDAYFSVFPPPLKSPPVSSQVLTALVSAATSEANETTTLTWNGGSGALALLAMAEDGAPATAGKTPVALGDKVMVTWADGAYTIVPSTGGPASAVEVDIDPSVPPNSLIGLVVGPAPILVGIPAGLGPLTLEPDLSPTATVVFGTACVYPPAPISDVDQGLTVTFSGTPTAAAQVAVGLDNLIQQTG
ncbi:hypothetical protein [Ensifer sp.]|jgi:hypothetical protein|uniref:hypothetical protein n=1 Tax=Ensifer sp. TaxID=1872086 RepID=UPI002E0E09C9|nr:hypothetical protein [Ensifer sp.]